MSEPIPEQYVREAASIYFGYDLTSKLTPEQWWKALDNYMCSYPTQLELRDTQALVIDRIATTLWQRDKAHTAEMSEANHALAVIQGYAECARRRDQSISGRDRQYTEPAP